MGPLALNEKKCLGEKKNIFQQTSSETIAQRECGASQTQVFAHLAWMDADGQDSMRPIQSAPLPFALAGVTI